LAYRRAATNSIGFTNGWEHYAAAGSQLLLWRNSSVDPPQGTLAEAEFVNQTLPMRERLDQLDTVLTDYQRQGQAGLLDQIDLATLGAIVDELAALQTSFAVFPAPSSLSNYAGLWEQTRQADQVAAQALLQARLADDPQLRATALEAVGPELVRRDQFRAAAQFAYSEVLAITTSFS
jgi:hypothetical protein